MVSECILISGLVGPADLPSDSVQTANLVGYKAVELVHQGLLSKEGNECYCIPYLEESQ